VEIYTVYKQEGVPVIIYMYKDNYICNGNAALLKVIGSLPPLLSVLVEIYFSLVGWVVAYNARGDISFFGGKTCSTGFYINIMAYMKKI
jgi:hypothetical protein